MPGMGGQHHSGVGRGMMGRSRANCCTSPEMAKKLGLSEDQVKNIDDLASKHRTAMIKMEADLKIACMEMQDLMDSNAGDSGIKGKAKAISVLRQKIEDARLSHMLDCRKILTAEQQKKMKTVCGPMYGHGMMGGCHSGHDCHR
ncbi:MAG: Spy/CpxP family protein refolding chaperone [Candidatus Edwardsbacteria bacterium]|nr:Spy/CpxP family protein refolding chaperone [Candidatus Edwardsbacteria bacterium]